MARRTPVSGTGTTWVARRPIGVRVEARVQKAARDGVGREAPGVGRVRLQQSPSLPNGACPGAPPGAQTCTDEGVYGPCSCADTTDAGAGADAGVVVPDGCVPDCAGRVCGPDPSCGTSCGACSAGECQSDGTCSDPAGPEVLRLNANISTMHPDDTLIITAVVTDPDGIDDVIGGSLIDSESGASYAAFATAASEGSYEVSLTWSAIQTVAPIYASRTFVAEFFDAAGHRGAGEIEIAFGCTNPMETPCDGTCVDLMTNSYHCGACDNDLGRVGEGEEGPTRDEWVPSCVDGAPDCGAGQLCGRWCVAKGNIEHCGACDQACPDAANACVCTDDACTVFACIFDTPFLLERRSCQDYCNDTEGFRCLETGGYEASYEYYCDVGGYDEYLTGCTRTPSASITTAGGFTCGFESAACTCVADPGCTFGPENSVAACTDGCSNDGDRYTDCEDRDCCALVSCPAGTYCGDM